MHFESLSFEDAVLHVEGPHLLWLQKVPLFYYSLRLLPTSNKSDKETEDDGDGKNVYE